MDALSVLSLLKRTWDILQSILGHKRKPPVDAEGDIRTNKAIDAGAAQMLTGSGEALLEHLEEEAQVSKAENEHQERYRPAPSSPDFEWDAFISHASHDKDPFVRQLANQLKSQGVKVWFDEFELKVGVSLRHSIDDGLARSRYGIVVLSKSFFQRQWTQRELGGLAARDGDGDELILPVWLGVDRKYVAQHSLLLADLVAVRADSGMDEVVRQLLQVLKPNQDSPLDNFKDPEPNARIIAGKIREDQEKATIPTPPGALMRARRYQEAKEAYTRLIRAQPLHHSLYVGRATAEAGSGDLRAAWKDFHTARQMNPSGIDVLRLQRMLQSGELEPRTDYRAPYQNDLDEGNKQLANGEWQKALEAYNLAGYKRIERYGPFPLHNAMAFLCGLDTKSALEALEKLEDSRQDPGELVEIWALRAIACALDNQDCQEIWAQLQSALVMCTGYSLRASEVRYLERGMALTGALRRNAKVLGVFKALPHSISAGM